MEADKKYSLADIVGVIKPLLNCESLHPRDLTLDGAPVELAIAVREARSIAIVDSGKFWTAPLHTGSISVYKAQIHDEDHTAAIFEVLEELIEEEERAKSLKPLGLTPQTLRAAECTLFGLEAK